MPRVTRNYPRSWQDRHGQINILQDEFLPVTDIARRSISNVEKEITTSYIPDDDNNIDLFTPSPQSNQTVKATCGIVVTKRKGWGSTGNKESDPLSVYGVERLLKHFDNDKYYRYLIKIYPKRMY